MNIHLSAGEIIRRTLQQKMDHARVFIFCSSDKTPDQCSAVYIKGVKESMNSHDMTSYNHHFPADDIESSSLTSCVDAKVCTNYVEQ